MRARIHFTQEARVALKKRRSARSRMDPHPRTVPAGEQSPTPHSERHYETGLEDDGIDLAVDVRAIERLATIEVPVRQGDELLLDEAALDDPLKVGGRQGGQAARLPLEGVLAREDRHEGGALVEQDRLELRQVAPRPRGHAGEGERVASLLAGRPR